MINRKKTLGAKALGATLMSFCLTQTLWTQSACAQLETATPTAAAPIDAAPIEDTTEAQSAFQAVVSTDGSADFRLTTPDRQGREAVFETCKYRRDGSLENETNSFYSPDGALLRVIECRFDAQSRFIEYSIFEYSISNAQGKLVGTTRIPRGETTKSNTTTKPKNGEKPLPIKVSGAKSSVISTVELSNKSGDGTKIVYKLRASGLLLSKTMTRALTPKVGAFNTVSQYDDKGLRREMSAFARNGERRSHVIFLRTPQRKLSAVQYGGAQNSINHVYNARGNLTESRVLQDGKVVQRFTTRYDAQARFIEYSIFDADGLQSRQAVLRDAKGRTIGLENYDGKNVLQSKTVVKNDAQGRQILEETRDAKGALLRRETREYRNGKLAKIVVTDRDGNVRTDTLDAPGKAVQSENAPAKTP